jgi:hypothetical protein
VEIKAYECEHCGSVYKNKAAYTKCVKTCINQKSIQTERLTAKQALEYDRNFPRLNATSIKHLTVLIKEAILKIRGVEVDFELRLAYNVTISTYHNCPIGESTKPNSNRVGFSGTLHYTLPNKCENDFFGGFSYGKAIVGIHTGGGGSGNIKNSYKYDMHFFLDDFPLLKEKVEAYHKTKEDYAVIDEKLAADAKIAIADDKIVQGYKLEIAEQETIINDLAIQLSDKKVRCQQYVCEAHRDACDAEIKRHQVLLKREWSKLM